MQLSVFFKISDIPNNEFESISETVNTYFNTLVDEPEDFHYWLKNLVFDKAKQEIRVFSDMSVDQDTYEAILRDLIETVAEHHTNTTLHGYYDLYNDNFGSCYHYFTLSYGELVWKVVDESEEDFLEEFEEYDSFEF